MAGQVPTFGLQFLMSDDAPVPVIGANLDVVGIIGPCATADQETFPPNTPVLVFSNDTTTLSLLGDDGYIPDAVNAINSQLADYQIAAQLVIVVTPYGTDSDANLKLQQTIANIMGDSIAGSGVWAFLKAPNALYCTPRLITAPGYTGQMANSLDTLTVTTEGVGYIPNATYQIAFAPGEGETNSANLVLPVATATADANGFIGDEQITIESWGAWMTVAPVAVLQLPDGPPVVGVAAAGQIEFQRCPGIGSTLTLNDTVITFQAPGSSGAYTSAATLLGGLAGEAATGWIGFISQPQASDTIAIGGTTVTFIATGTPSGNQVLIGSTLGATMNNLLAFLQGSADANLSLCSYTLTGTTINIAAKATGTNGNNITLATAVHLTGDNVLIAANYDLAGTLANLLAFLQASADENIAENTYSIVAGTSTLLIEQQATGSAGNGYTIASTVTGVVLSGQTLTGGIDAAESTTALLAATLALGANPVVAELSGGVLDGLIGIGVVESSGVSMIGDENWRDTISSQRIVALSGGVKVQDPVSGDIIVMPLAPRVVGLIIAVDFAVGYPCNSAANQAISGIVGPARTIDFSLTDGSTEGQLLLAANIGIVVRGEIGVETAIAAGGFVLICTDSCSADPLWQFYNVQRTADYINLSLMPVLRIYLGRNNINRQTVINLMTTVNAFLAGMQSLNLILGYSSSFLGSANTAAEIRAGQLTIGFAFEPPPPLCLITSQEARYAPAIDAMVAELQSELAA